MYWKVDIHSVTAHEPHWGYQGKFKRSSPFHLQNGLFLRNYLHWKKLLNHLSIHSENSNCTFTYITVSVDTNFLNPTIRSFFSQSICSQIAYCTGNHGDVSGEKHAEQLEVLSRGIRWLKTWPWTINYRYFIVWTVFAERWSAMYLVFCQTEL